MPKDDAHADRDVERMLRAELRYLKAHVGCIDNVLTDAGHFVSEDHRILHARFRSEGIQHHRTYGLFGADHDIPVLLQAADSFHCVIDMLPDHAVLRA